MTVPVFDHDSISDLDETVGAAKRNALLFYLAERSEKLPETIRHLIGAKKFDRARYEAQKLRNTATQVGAYQLIDCLLYIELYASSQSIDDVFVDRFRRVAHAVMQEARAVIGRSSPV